MRILGADTRLPPVNSSRWSEPRPLACPRAEAARGTYAADLGLAAAKSALKQASCRPSQVDLILSMGMSPDHVVDRPEVVAPRLAHPVQNGLGATNAYVFDLLDADWAFAIDVAQGFAVQQGYKRVLVVRGDVTAPGLVPDLESGFAFPDGAGAILLATEAVPGTPWATHYRQVDGFAGARIVPLPAERLAQGAERCRHVFPAAPGMVEALDAAGRALLAAELARAPADHVATDRWFPGLLDDSGGTCDDWPGQLTLPLAVAALLARGCRPAAQLVSLTFSPSLMRFGCQRLVM